MLRCEQEKKLAEARAELEQHLQTLGGEATEATAAHEAQLRQQSEAAAEQLRKQRLEQESEAERELAAEVGAVRARNEDELRALRATAEEQAARHAAELEEAEK
eukprot:COSAG06_NODE_32815_length_499_cov_112.010000_1_plen_103_part_01